MATATFAQTPVKVEVKPHAGRPAVFVNDQPLALTAYSPVAGKRMKMFEDQTARIGGRCIRTNCL